MKHQMKRTLLVLRFGAGIQAGDIKLGLGSLLIKVGNNPADAIHIEGFNPGDALGQASIDRFDGTGNGIANDSTWRVAA